MTTRMAAMCLLTALLAGCKTFADDKYAFAVIGDMPYAPTVETANGRSQVYPADAYQRLIDDINSDGDVAFTVHVGDIKAGKTLCSDDVYAQNLNYFNSFEQGVIYTPGYNEWTDCHKDSNGSFDPINRLALIRTTFFSDNRSLGQQKLDRPAQERYPENAMWGKGPVLFVTLHQPGSNNHHQQAYDGFTEDEYKNRNEANMTWLDEAFNKAEGTGAIKGIAIFSQANPFERFLESADSGYADFINKLRSKTIASQKRVIYFGGDTHYMRIDQPMTKTYPGCEPDKSPCSAVNVPRKPRDRIHNFTRVEVFGENDIHWIKVEVSNTDPGVFKFTPRRVPEN